jgi:hypothetical protein
MLDGRGLPLLRGRAEKWPLARRMALGPRRCVTGRIGSGTRACVALGPVLRKLKRGPNCRRGKPFLVLPPTEIEWRSVKLKNVAQSTVPAAPCSGTLRARVGTYQWYW